MQNTYLKYFLAALLVLAPVARTAMAAPQRQQRTSAEEVKIKVAKLGTGAKAKATVWLANGTKVKGYISQAGENDFVMRDRKDRRPHDRQLYRRNEVRAQQRAFDGKVGRARRRCRRGRLPANRARFDRGPGLVEFGDPSPLCL